MAGSSRSVSDGRQSGQVLLLLVAALLAVVVGALVIGSVARGLGDRADHLGAADLAALAGARAMRDSYPRLFEPPRFAGAPNPNHLERAAYLALGVAAAWATARRNGVREVHVSFPHADAIAPVRIRVAVGRSGRRARRGGGGAGGRGGRAQPAEQCAGPGCGRGPVRGAARTADNRAIAGRETDLTALNLDAGQPVRPSRGF